ncbi:MAG: glycosyltransferase family 4 protein [Pseudomonadales bacterium]
MKILYVTGITAPILDILNGKYDDEITGAPAFFYPWRKLVEKGHQVDFIFLSNFNEDINIRVGWFDEKNIYANIYDPASEQSWYLRVFRRAKRFFKLLYYTNKAVTEHGYDFVYCKAYYEGLAGNLVANYRGVPCGMRSMGTTLYKDFQLYGPWITALKRPAEYLTFRLKKNFFLMTDDGTKGDIIHRGWASDADYDFLFWKTGIEIKKISDVDPTMPVPEHKYIFYAARIDDWKRHDRVLSTLHKLHSSGCNLHVYFAGSIRSQQHFDWLGGIVEKYGLEDFVHFLGPIKQDDVKNLAYHAVANPLMYDHSNLGNVFFEIFSVGAIVVALDDGSLDDYVSDGETGYIVTNEEEACRRIMKIAMGDDVSKIRSGAIECAKEKFMSIDERFDREVELIEGIVDQV